MINLVISKAKKESLYKITAILVTLLSAAYFIVALQKHASEIPDFAWSFTFGVVAFISVLLVLLYICLGGLIWWLLLVDGGCKVQWEKAIIIFFLAQFGKYVPGNVGQHIGRISLARSIGIPVSITGRTLFVEIVWGTAIAGGLSLAALLFFADAKSIDIDLEVSPVLILFGVVFLLFLPWFIIYFLNKCMPGLAKRLASGAAIAAPRLHAAIMAGFLFFLCFLIVGLILKFQATYFFNVSSVDLFEITCLFSFAWLVGYLMPGAPGGIGVREAMMVLLLSPVFGVGVAVGLGVTLRLTTTIGDGIAFLIGVLVWKKINGRETGSETTTPLN
jgi:hypothetical protein